MSCRNAERVVVELDWSIFSLAFAELLSLREQVPERQQALETKDTPIRVSLAETMRAIRRAMRERNETVSLHESLDQVLRNALIQTYTNRTDKRSRYRPANPDKKPLGDPSVRAPNAQEKQNLARSSLSNAA
ncbi:MAG: hypothetical protein AAGD07_01525 [Planctomycetota bacterium]